MIYYGNNDYRDYLAHHGVLGMHWGIRRFQPYSLIPRGSGKAGKEIGEAKTGKPTTARQYTRQLSKLAKKRDVDKLHLYDAARKAENAKSQKAYDKATAKANKLRDSIKHTESSIQNVIESAKKDGMNVKEFTKTRDIAAGRKAIATVVGALGGASAAMALNEIGIKAKDANKAFNNITLIKEKEYSPMSIYTAYGKAHQAAAASSAVSGALLGGKLARSGYSAAYKAIHGRDSKIKGTHYKVTTRQNKEKENRKKEFDSYNPENIEEFYEKKKDKKE